MSETLCRLCGANAEMANTCARTECAFPMVRLMTNKCAEGPRIYSAHEIADKYDNEGTIAGDAMFVTKAEYDGQTRKSFGIIQDLNIELSAAKSELLESQQAGFWGRTCARLQAKNTTLKSLCSDLVVKLERTNAKEVVESWRRETTILLNQAKEILK